MARAALAGVLLLNAGTFLAAPAVILAGLALFTPAAVCAFRGLA